MCEKVKSLLTSNLIIMKNWLLLLVFAAVIIAVAACSSQRNSTKFATHSSGLLEILKNRDYVIDFTDISGSQSIGVMQILGDTLYSCMDYDFIDPEYAAITPFEDENPPMYKHEMMDYKVKSGRKGMMEVSFSCTLPRYQNFSYKGRFLLRIYPEGKVLFTLNEGEYYKGTLLFREITRDTTISE